MRSNIFRVWFREQYLLIALVVLASVVAVFGADTNDAKIVALPIRLSKEERTQLYKDAEIIRQMVQHESEQINRRLTWMMTIHGFLITAIALIWTGKIPPRRSFILCKAMCWAAVFIASFTLLGLFVSSRALFNHMLWWTSHSVKYDGPPVIGVWVQNKPWYVFMSMDNFIGIVLLVAWSTLLCWLYKFKAKLMLHKSDKSPSPPTAPASPRNTSAPTQSPDQHDRSAPPQPN